MREGHASVAPQPAEFSQLQGHGKEKFTKRLLFGWPGSLESLEEEETGFYRASASLCLPS